MRDSSPAERAVPHSTWRLFTESLPVTVSMLLGQLMYSFDTIALAALGRGAEIGLYVAAYRCATVAAPLLGHLQSSIFPRLARAHRRPHELRRDSLLLAGGAAALGLAAGLVLALAAPLFMRILFGRSYLAGALYLRILAWVLPLQCARAVLRQVLLSGGRQLTDTRNIALGAATSIVVDFASIPFWGALGCCAATICSEVVFLGASVHGVRRLLRESAA